MIQARLQEHRRVLDLASQDAVLLASLSAIIDRSTDLFKRNGKLLLCGNGGSAADAQHLAAEFSGRYFIDRPPLYAEALHVNTSYLTAVANDYDFSVIYARMVKAIGAKGDMLWCLSTSGNSANIVKAAIAAQAVSMTVVGFTGESGGALAAHCDFLLNIPSQSTPRIQEMHMLLGHIVCEQVEATIFGS